MADKIKYDKIQLLLLFLCASMPMLTDVATWVMVGASNHENGCQVSLCVEWTRYEQKDPHFPTCGTVLIMPVRLV